jgi:AraC family transcriptional regulator of adaptative response / DNA-3-methyladenine glycosylase II
LRGVGAFIAEGIVLRGAGLVDEVPSDEVTMQGILQAYRLPAMPDRAQALRIAEQWRPYRMWCSVLVHMSLRSGGASFRTRKR